MYPFGAPLFCRFLQVWLLAVCLPYLIRVPLASCCLCYLDPTFPAYLHSGGDSSLLRISSIKRPCSSFTILCLGNQTIIGVLDNPVQIILGVIIKDCNDDPTLHHLGETFVDRMCLHFVLLSFGRSTSDRPLPLRTLCDLLSRGSTSIRMRAALLLSL